MDLILMTTVIVLRLYIMEQLWLYLSIYKWDLDCFRWDCIVRDQCSDLFLYHFLLLKIIENYCYTVTLWYCYIVINTVVIIFTVTILPQWSK